MKEWTHFFIKIYLSHFILERGYFLCVRGELETRTDCYILTPSSSDHSSTSFAFWLGCSTVGHKGPKALRLPLALNSASCPQLTPSATGTELTQAICGIWLYFCLTPTCFLWVYASATIAQFNHVHRSSWYSNIFDRIHLFHCSSAYLHRCISWLMARSRVNMLHRYILHQLPLWSGVRSPIPGMSVLDLTLNNKMVRLH